MMIDQILVVCVCVLCAQAHIESSSHIVVEKRDLLNESENDTQTNGDNEDDDYDNGDIDDKKGDKVRLAPIILCFFGCKKGENIQKKMRKEKKFAFEC